VPSADSRVFRKYPSLLVLIFVVAGIVTADSSHLPSWSFLIVSLVALVLGSFAYTTARTVPAVLLLSACMAGFAAFQFSHQYVDVGPRHLSRAVSGRAIYRIYGSVADWPELRPGRTEIKVAVDSLVSDRTQDVQGAILLKVTDTTTSLQRGDRVEFRGRIYGLPPAGDGSGFDYRRYLTLKGVSGIVYLPTLLDVRVDRRARYGFLSVVDNLRSWVVATLNKNLSPVAAALATGFLIGETRNIPPEVYRMFRDSGTLHLLAVSGSNVTLVLMFFIVLMRPFSLPPFRRAVILLVVIVVFTALSYGEPSVVRASVMAVLVILARFAQRRHNLNNIIALTALIILIVQPSQLFDVGFQLSFVTAWGLIFIVPRLSARFETFHGRWWYRWLVFPLMISVVAQVCSTPLIAYYFGRIPVISVLANLVIVPLVSLAVIGVLSVLAAQILWPMLGLFVGSVIDKLLLLVVAALRQFGGDQIPVLEVSTILPDSLSVPTAVFAYTLVVLFTLAVRHRLARRLAMLAALIGINLALVFAVVRATAGTERWVSLHAVPGGIAAFVGGSESDGTDLILHGLSGVTYALDEKVFQPLLADLKLESLDRIFLLSTDYDAVDDVIRLAGKFDAGPVYVHRRAAAMFADVLARKGGAGTPLDVRYFGSSGDGPPEPGYLADDRGFWLHARGAHMLFADGLNDTHSTPLPDTLRAILVLGRSWSPTVGEWVTLRELGYSLIVCSRVAQYPDDTDDPSDFNPDRVLPEFIYVLKERGSLRIPLGHGSERIR